MLNYCNKGSACGRGGCGQCDGGGHHAHHGHGHHFSDGVYHGAAVQTVSQVVGFHAQPLVSEGVPGALRFMGSFVEPVLMRPVVGHVHHGHHHEHVQHDRGHSHGHHHDRHVRGCRCDACHRVPHTHGVGHHHFVEEGCHKPAIDMRSCRAKRASGRSC